MTAKVPPEVMGKIRKCFALTRSNFEHEADTALAMAQKLMAEYGLSMKDVDLNADGTVKATSFLQSYSDPMRLQPWEKDLGVVPALLLPVEFLFSQFDQKKYRLLYVGTETDCEMAQELWKMLRAELMRISASEGSDPVARRSFCQGAVWTIVRRAGKIKAHREEQEKATRANPGLRSVDQSANCLMVIKQQSISEWTKRTLCPETMRSRGGSALNNPALDRGRAAGDRVRLGVHKELA